MPKTGLWKGNLVVSSPNKLFVRFTTEYDNFLLHFLFFSNLYIDALLADLQNSVPGQQNALHNNNQNGNSGGYGSLRPKQSPVSVIVFFFIFHVHFILF